MTQWAEGDAVMNLKRENGRLTQELRERRETTDKLIERLRYVIESYIDECGPETAHSFHECQEEPECTRDAPCELLRSGILILKEVPK